jgi:hypothetical protein
LAALEEMNVEDVADTPQEAYDPFDTINS